MRILTVRQPWAWAIIHGGKDVENRVRNIAGAYRGPVAIHAGLAYDSAWSSRALDDAMQASGARLRSAPMPWWAEEGHIIGLVDLVDVHVAGPFTGECYLLDRPVAIETCSPWAEQEGHAFHLRLANPRPLRKPMPWKGSLGLRELPDDVAATIIERSI